MNYDKLPDGHDWKYLMFTKDIIICKTCNICLYNLIGWEPDSITRSKGIAIVPKNCEETLFILKMHDALK